MKVFGMCLGRPSAADLDALVDRVRDQQVTYDHVGSTLLPDGGGRPRFFQHHRDIGHGREDFDRGVLGLRQWAGHRRIGATVHPPDASLELGIDLVVVLPLGPFSALAPDRIVAVVDESEHVAFSYGTLPGHPERGEETFSLQLRDDGTVRFTISVDAVPGNPVMWLGGPIVKHMQRRALNGYLEGVAIFVTGARSD
jgi:uncharacterized protein (UPF0548 family)